MAETFCFEGFEPTPELKRFAKDLLWRAENRAPSQAFVKAKITKTSSGFLAKIQFSSQAGQFDAETMGENAKEALFNVYTKIRRELLDWKKGRLTFI